MITFSIITCTYNAAEVLQRTLDSVARQTYPNIEHIIVDGASKDNTMAMVADYKLSSPHPLTIISERDKGLYDAMNKGIQLAKGDYIVFLNAGDIFPSEQTISQELIGGESKELPGVLYGNTDIVNEKGEFLYHRRLQPPKHLSWRSFKNGMLVCHQSFYARTSIAKQTPYDLHYRLSADVDWCIRIMKKAEEQGLTLHNTNRVLCNYLEGGMSIKNHRASLIERFHIMRKHYGLISTIIKHISFFFR
ncbi:MAG: glycosyltransferase [Prevotella sp.]|nr:glycosyltransferase [Candidatus Prevotella equi]